MSHSQGPPGRRHSRRLAPDELAREVANRLKTGPSPRGGHRRRRSFDVVTLTRILMVLAVVGLGVGAVYGVAWIGRAGHETTGKVIETRGVSGCPGESELGAVFDGETVEVVGRSEDGRSYVLRDQRGPGGLVYVDAEAVAEVEDPERLPVRSCEPRSESEVAAAELSSPTTTSMIVSTTNRGSTTTVPETSTTQAEPGSARPARRGTPSPGAPPTTSPATPTDPTTTTPGSSPTTPPTTAPGAPGTSPTTAPTTTTTTSTTTTTTTPTTTVSTTTTVPETTTTELTTTTTATTTSTTTP